MSRLEWSRPENRTYQRGLDRGVLYPASGPGVVWDGLVSVAESASEASVTPFYYEGLKRHDERVPGDFAGTLSAITYPDEFLQYEGVARVSFRGLLATHQEVDSTFGLAYRTYVGDALKGDDLGYKIHLLYNLTALPDTRTHVTLGGVDDLTPFVWSLSGAPVAIPGARPTVHLILDTTSLGIYAVNDVEDILYGNEWEEPRLPYPEELIEILNTWSPLTIVDNGDGTWTATGSATDVRMLTEDIFWIESDSAVMLNKDTYRISNQEDPRPPQ